MLLGLRSQPHRAFTENEEAGSWTLEILRGDQGGKGCFSQAGYTPSTRFIASDGDIGHLAKMVFVRLLSIFPVKSSLVP